MRLAPELETVRKVLPGLSVSLVLFVLVACGSVGGGPGGGSGGGGNVSDPPLISGSESPAYVLSVDTSPGDTIAGIEETYRGKVIVWSPGTDLERGFALLGLMEAPVIGDPAYGLLLESNEKAFTAGGTISASGASTMWAGGASTMWAGGASTMWAGGASTMWAGGEFEWLPENTDLWSQVRLEQAHRLSANLGLGIKVAVIDTGVDLEHPALKEALAPSSEWWDFVDDDAVPQEIGEFGTGGHGHGTNVAGIIRQVAPRATILPIRVLDSEGRGTLANLAAAIDWAVLMGADVINLSLGADKKLNTVDKALKRAAGQGVFVVSSAGNDNLKDLTYPAMEAGTGSPVQREHMLSVSSVDRNDVKSSFANYHHKLELTAPGEQVYGPAPSAGGEPQMAYWSGTSMAAPIAAGAIALAMGEELAVERHHLAEHLKTTSTDVYGLDGNAPYASPPKLGEGRLDMHQLLLEVSGPGGG